MAAIAAAVRGRAQLQTGGGVRTVDDVDGAGRGRREPRRDGFGGGRATRRSSRVAAAVLPVAVGLDHRDGELAVHGWTRGQRRAARPTRCRLFPAASAFVITDIARDGMLDGPDVDGLAEAVAATDVPVIASGGVASLDDSPRWRRSPAWAGSSPARRSTKAASPSPRRSPRWPSEVGVMQVARVIPCLDVTDGRVVKGINFVDLRDAGDPVELAARYDAEGADELVFLDITASSDARDTMVDMVYRVAEQVYIPFTVGGGIRTLEDARRMLRAGADKVSVNTAAVQRPELIARDRRRVRRAVRGVRDRRQASRCRGIGRVRGVPARWPHADRHRRRRVGAVGRSRSVPARSC